MTSPNPSRSLSVAQLVATGFTLLTAGLALLGVMFLSSLGRYMHIEGLGLALTEDEMRALTGLTDMDKGFIYLGVALSLIGVATLVASVLRSRPESANPR